MNKIIISVLLGLTLLGAITGFVEAEKNTPFDYKVNGIEIINYELDLNDIELILEVEVTDVPATIEITFERDFFDSKNLEKDSEFTIIGDGELVYYDEIITNSKYRTLRFNLASDVELVEIFGTQIKGMKVQTPIIESSEKISNVKQNNNDQINELIKENQILKKDNQLLKKENAELDGRIFELENLVSALENQVKNLNAVVTEQVKVIYNWVLG